MKRARERVQKRDQISTLGREETEWSDVAVEERIGSTTSIIKFDDVLERCQTSVVHVGGGSSDVAKGGSLERATIRRGLRYDEAIRVAALGCYAGIMKFFIGEV